MGKGWIYILRHSSGQNVKVGETKVNPEIRAKDYIKTYQLRDFKLFKTFQVPIHLRKDIEKKVHERLSSKGLRLSGLDGAREIFACTPEIAEKAVLEEIRTRDKLTEIFIKALNLENKFYGNRPNFRLELYEYISSLNKLLGFDHTLAEDQLKEIRQLYDYSKNFFISNWYKYFKRNTNLCNYTNGYYPPLQFWQYISALVEIVKSKNYFTESERLEILTSWQNQIIELLDKQYLDQNNIYYSGFFGNEFLNNLKMQSDPKKINHIWIDLIAPYIKPYLEDKEISNLISRFNKLGIIHMNAIEYLVYVIDKKFNKLKFDWTGSVGGTLAAESFEEGRHFELKSDLIRNLKFIKEYDALHIIKNLSDEILLNNSNGDNTSTIDLMEIIEKEVKKLTTESLLHE